MTWKTWPGVPSLSPMTSWSMCSECWHSSVAPIGDAVIEETSGGRSYAASPASCGEATRQRSQCRRWPASGRRWQLGASSSSTSPLPKLKPPVVSSSTVTRSQMSSPVGVSPVPISQRSGGRRGSMPAPRAGSASTSMRMSSFESDSSKPRWIASSGSGTAENAARSAPTGRATPTSTGMSRTRPSRWVT